MSASSSFYVHQWQLIRLASLASNTSTPSRMLVVVGHFAFDPHDPSIVCVIASALDLSNMPGEVFDVVFGIENATLGSQCAP